MKKFIFALIMILLTGGLSGCLTTKAALRVQQYKAGGIEDAKLMTREMLQTWLFRSGVIRGALKAHMLELPKQAVDALWELDYLAKKNQEGELDDHDLGLFLGTRMRMISATVRAAVETYAPNVMAYVPF